MSDTNYHIDHANNPHESDSFRQLHALISIALELKRYNDRNEQWDAELRNDVKMTRATVEAGVISLEQARQARSPLGVR